MFKNNLKIAFRSLLRQRVYTLINLMGLSVGVASCLLILLFVQNEFSYDSFFKDGDRIYRMVLERKYPNHATNYSVVPHSFAAVAAKDFPEIELASVVGGFPDFNLSYKDARDEVKQFDERFTLISDSTFLKMFSFQLIKGNAATVLSSANEIIMTEETARRYFGEEDPIGKIVKGGNQEFKVTGVLQNIPSNSHFQFNAIVSLESFPFLKRENFTSFSAYTYFRLKPNALPGELEAKFPKMVDTYAAAQIERNLGKSWEDYKKEGNGYRYFLQPLSEIHLDPMIIESQMKSSGNRTTVYIMIAVAMLILVIACINFMNLATARSSERAKEVGVRKTMGSFRQQLIFQFLTESLVLSVVGVVMAVLLIYLLLPYFNSLTEKQLVFSLSATSMLGLSALALVVGILAGIYPSFILSGFNPVIVMKGNFTSSTKGKWIRNGLVIFQFWISIILMIGTLVIGKQMEFMQHKSLGFDKEQMLVVERVFTLDAQKSRTLIEEIRRMPEVASAAGSFAMPGKENDFFGIQFQPEGSSEILTTKSMIVADGLAETLGFEMAAGRFFSPETNDSLTIILNEAAVKVMDLENPVGRKLMNVQQNQDGSNVTRAYTIAGVVKDFNFISLKEAITPLVLQSNEAFGNGAGYVMVRVKAGQIQSAIHSIEAKWKDLNPEQAFKFSFLDQNIDAQYQSERQAGNLFAVFSGLAIFVACIGLFALSAYTASLRTKEIGIRKVLGASVSGIVVLLSQDFTKLIMLAFLLAVPMAWYIMENWWLSTFAYRIEIGAGIILFAGFMAFLIGWLTVSYQSIKTAVRNPIQSLRSE